MEIEGVVLAAGLSQRAGTNKLTLRLGKTTVIEKCLEGMYDLCSRIIVVGGYRIENLARILSKYPKVELVFNKDYPSGMFSSVKEGFRQVRGERFFFTPGDYPLINKNVYEKMMKAKGDIIVPVYKGEQGHPVLINGCLARELVEDSAYANLREFIAAKDFTAVEVEDQGILLDIDTIEDYLKVVSLIPRG